LFVQRSVAKRVQVWIPLRSPREAQHSQ